MINNQLTTLIHSCTVNGVVDLFTFPNGGNRKKHGGHVTLMWLAAPSSAFDLAVLYLESWTETPYEAY